METVLNGCVLRCGSYDEVLTDFYGKVNLIVTSPPYNIGTKGPANYANRRMGKFDPKSYGGVQAYVDSQPEDEYQEWQINFISWCFERMLAPNGVLVYNHKNRHKSSYRRYSIISPLEWILPLQSAGKLVIRDEIVWDRGSTHNHDKRYLYPQSERIYVMQRPSDKPYFANLDYKGKNKGSGDVWRIPPLTHRPVRDCCFPLQIPITCIKMLSQEGDLVCDPFSGSGSTMLAARDTGRKFVGSELRRDAFNLASSRLFKV